MISKATVRSSLTDLSTYKIAALSYQFITKDKVTIEFSNSYRTKQQHDRHGASIHRMNCEYHIRTLFLKINGSRQSRFEITRPGYTKMTMKGIEAVKRIEADSVCYLTDSGY